MSFVTKEECVLNRCEYFFSLIPFYKLFKCFQQSFHRSMCFVDTDWQIFDSHNICEIHLPFIWPIVSKQAWTTREGKHSSNFISLMDAKKSLFSYFFRYRRSRQWTAMRSIANFSLQFIAYFCPALLISHCSYSHCSYSNGVLSPLELTIWFYHKCIYSSKGSSGTGDTFRLLMGV